MYQYPIYADVAFEIIGRAIEEITGVAYEDWIQKYVFGPLNMTNTFFNLTPDRAKQVPPGYAGSVALPNWLTHYPMNWANPTGGAYTSTRDIAKFVSLWLTNYEERMQNPLGMQPQTLNEMMLPVFWNADGLTGYGSPFELYLLNYGSGYLVKTKAGMQPGYASSFHIYEEIDTALVYTGNSVNGVGYLFSAGYSLIPAFERVLQDFAQPPAAPSNISSFVGNYLASIWMGSIYFSANITLMSESMLFVNISSSMIATSTVNMFALNATWFSGNDFLLNSPSGASTCMLQSGNDLLSFQTKGDTVLSFSMQSTEPFYGTTFYKK